MLAYFDCFAGAGGDMIVGALLHAGADFGALQVELAKLGVPGYAVRCEKAHRGGIVGLRFHVDAQEQQPHRRLGDILAITENAALAPRVKERARQVFARLAEAEAKVHGIAPQEVHFHEIGAIDSIVDVVGSCVALELLGVEKVLCSPIPLGSGTVQTEHGQLPLPAPATAELLVGAKTFDNGAIGEATTPTAAAVLTTLAESFGPPPAMTVAAVGYGAGSRDPGPLPNLLRVLLGRQDPMGSTDTVVELSANIDDCTGEVIGATVQKLLAAGCLDAWACPIFMKKSRPAWMLCVLCEPGSVEAAQKILFTETTTFGIRRRLCERAKLLRYHQTVETPYGPIRVKTGQLDGRTITASAEFADCLSAAETHHVPVREVIRAAEAIWWRENRP